MITYKRVGGIRFLTLGRLSVQWSVKAKPLTSAQKDACQLGWWEGWSPEALARREGLSLALVKAEYRECQTRYDEWLDRFDDENERDRAYAAMSIEELEAL